MRVLSLDVGAKKIGVALSNVNCDLIYPISGIKMDRFNGRTFFSILKKTIGDAWNEIDRVVIGNGLDFDSHNPVSKIVNQVERILKSWTDWKVDLIFETNSSCESMEFLKRINVPCKKRFEVVDSWAALFILQDYLNSQNKTALIGF